MLEFFRTVRNRLSLSSFLVGLAVGAVSAGVVAVTTVLSLIFFTVEEDGSGFAQGVYGVDVVYCLPGAPCQD